MESVSHVVDSSPLSGQPSRMHSAVFQSIGEEGRAETVERRISEAISAGILAPGEKLPSEAALAKSFGVAPVTAREALLALRERGLVVTKRGRQGGSFVSSTARPEVDTAQRLGQMTRLALRDLAAHYLAITTACAELAADRADVTEVDLIRSRLLAAADSDPVRWRRVADDAMIEISALSQSARLTREQMRLQTEYAALRSLADADPVRGPANRVAMDELVDAVSRGDGDAASRVLRVNVMDNITWLVREQARLQQFESDRGRLDGTR